MAFNKTEGYAVLFGGSNQSYPLRDTWELQSPNQPAIQFSLSLAEDIQKKNIEDIRVRAFCSAENTTDTTATGARLYGWVTSHERFELLAENTDPLSNNNALLDYAPMISAKSKAQGFFSTQNKMYFQCRANSSRPGAKISRLITWKSE